MLSSAGLEVMNSTNPELNWKIVTKGRRSRKSAARRLNGGVKADNSISPKRVGDFTGSDCDKFGELIPGRLTSGKSESVPPKKRRHLLQSPTPLSPLCGAAQRTGSSSPFSEDHEQLQYPSCSLGQGFNVTGDFSGIELLAAAASMDDDIAKANDKDHQEDFSMPNNSDSSSSATLSNVVLKNNESENSSSNTNMECSQERNSASASKSHGLSPEDGTVPKVSRQHWDLNTLMDAWEEPYTDSIAGDTNDANNMHMEGMQKVSKDESSNQILEENKSTSVSEEIICSEPHNAKELLQEQSMNIYSIGATKIPDQAGEIQVLNCDADVKKLNEITSPDAILESSTVTKLCLSSEENANSISRTVAIMQDEDCSSTVERRAQGVNEHDILASETVIDVQHKDTQEFPGMFAQPATFSVLNKQNDPVELDAKHEESYHHLNDGSKRSKMDEFDVPTASVGRNDGDDFTGFQEGYDSPYEDGELRGSFACSWEENEIENESVDYESDGRNGDGSDAAYYPASSEIVEGGSEVSQKTSPQARSKSVGQESLRKHFVKDNNEVAAAAGKASNAGSGTTVEMVLEEERLINRREAVVDVNKATDINEYAIKMMSARGKLQSRVGGRSSANFMQEFRPRRLGGSYSRGERDVSPDRYMNRYRSNPNPNPNPHVERDQWGPPRRRYNNTSNYQGPEGRRPRSKIGESGEGPEFQDSRQSGNYMARGLNRPLMRRSPAERDEYFVGRRTLPITRGVANYRSRGHYSQRGGARDFVEDFEPIPEDAGPPPPVRYFSRRERSFSPHMTRRRSRSRSREWHPNREQQRILGGNGNGNRRRSPEFRPEGRMGRMRLPFSKPSFADASDYVDDYMSPPPPPRGRFSPPPQQNCRWGDDRSFAERRRRSPPPVRLMKRTQRFDAGRGKSDDYFRPVARSGRFSFMGNGGGKFESNYQDRRREEGGGGEMMQHRGRFRNNGGDNFETNNKLNNEDDVRVSEPTTQTQEDKSGFNI